WSENKWQRITHFGFLPSRVLTEVRDIVYKLDPEFNPLIHFKTPKGEPAAVPLFNMPTFFWPKGQI
ncbi:MAG TPA: hypothetical protein VFS31_03175, partial [Chitinophagaceae bacterium]|nr:hypothetical protein [Chitinophagaceae bacterium]